MQFSAFASFGGGGFAFSSSPTLARRIYDALWANLGTSYARDGYTDARVYATAMALGRLLAAQGRLDAQIDPATVLELLPDREREHGLIVPATATIASRREALAAQMRLPNGCSTPSLLQAVIDLLGAGFVEFRYTDALSAVTYPDPPGAPGNFCDSRTTRRLFRLRAISTAPAELNTALVPWSVEAVDGTAVPLAELPQPGEYVVVEPENSALRERVLVAKVDVSAGVARIYGALTNPHHQHARVLAGVWPLWTSTRRHTTVRVTTAVTNDGAQWRRLDELLAKLFRAVSTWSINDNDGPFLLGSSRLGVTPLVDP